MDKRKICLFTAHSPKTGGGGVILRSLIENLPDISISWYYITKEIAVGYEQGYLGQGFMGNGIIEDIFETSKMLSNRRSLKIDKIVEQLLNVDCDGYWVISHNEGLRIALELTRRQKERPVHMSIHDDWAGALCVRSFRYRLMAGLAKKLTKTTLEQVTSFDVVSQGMRDYYKQLTGRDSEVTHRYITSNDVAENQVFESNELAKVTVGHIGSIYVKEDFFKFLALFHEFAQLKNKKPEVHIWGYHLDPGKIPKDFRDSIHFHPTLPEDQVIPELSRCTFVYAMYPMQKSLRLFSITSLPTKLGSYIQARRPIFGQGCSESSLAEFLNTTSTGEIWDTSQKKKGIDILNRIVELNPSLPQWQNARKKYFGEDNVMAMRRVFLRDK